jgi:branched-chain amino acid transport system substrate-binding protein
MVADQTGALAGTFGEAPAGLQTYVDQTNAAGGINGHKISIKILNAQSDPNAALVAFRQAISANPDAILHAGVSSELASGQSLLSSAGIPVVSDSTVDTLLVPKPAPWFFSLDPTASQFVGVQLEQIVKAAGGSLQGKKLAIVEGVSASLSEQLQFAEHQYAKQYGYTYTVTTISNGISAFPQAASIASSHPAGALLLTIGNDTAVIVKALTSAGLKIPMVSNTTGASDAFITQVGLNSYFGLEQAPTPRAGSSLLALAQKYGQGGTANNPSYSLGYADGYLIGQALEKCGNNCDSAAVSKALETFNNVTVPNGAMYEPVSFSVTNHLGLGAVGFNTYDPANKSVASASVIKLPPVISG